jgi:small subunit ribosomal protein S17
MYTTNRRKMKQKTEKAEAKMEEENPRTPKLGRPEAKMEEEKTKDSCSDVKCPFHGRLKARGKIFEGKITNKFPKRVSVELERMVYVRKYERYKKSKTKIHARLPDCLEKEIAVGDFVKVQECRPLSKIIHFVVIEKIRSSLQEKEK